MYYLNSKEPLVNCRILFVAFDANYYDFFQLFAFALSIISTRTKKKLCKMCQKWFMYLRGKIEKIGRSITGLFAIEEEMVKSPCY